jgi:hypothetical protein
MVIGVARMAVLAVWLAHLLEVVALRRWA